MKEFMTKALPSLCGGLTGFILGGILATFLDEKIGYSFLFAYLYGMFGHDFIKGLIQDKLKK
jgi:hypothetical protein